MTDQVEATEAEATDTKKLRVARVEQNGVSRPTGAMTGRVWEIADEISAREGRPALRGEVIEQSETEGLNRGTITTQYGRWMTFNGVDKAQLAEIRKQLKADAAPAEDEAAQDEAAPIDDEADEDEADEDEGDYDE